MHLQRLFVSMILLLAVLGCRREDPCPDKDCYDQDVTHLGEFDSLIDSYARPSVFTNGTQTGYFGSGTSPASNSVGEYPVQCTESNDCNSQLSDIYIRSTGRYLNFSTNTFVVSYTDPNGHPRSDGVTGFAYQSVKGFRGTSETGHDDIHVSINSTWSYKGTGEKLWFIWSPSDSPNVGQMNVNGKLYNDVYLIENPSYATYHPSYESESFLLDAHSLYISKDSGLVQFNVGNQVYSRK